MRTLPAALQAAQQTRSARPAVRLSVDDRFCGLPRFHFSQVRQDFAIPNRHSAAVCWGSYLGFLTSDAAATPKFYRYAAAAPPGTPFVYTLTGTTPSDCQVALVYHGTTLWAFVIGSTYRTLYYATSTDNGLTWSGWTPFYSFAVGTTVKSLTAISGGSTWATWLLFCDPDPATDTAVVNVFASDGSTIYGPFAWTRDPGTISGLAAFPVITGDSTYIGAHFLVAGKVEDPTAWSFRLYHLQLNSPPSLFRFWTYRGPVLPGANRPGFSWAAPSCTTTPDGRSYFIAQETSPASTYPIFLSLTRLGLSGPVGASPRRPLPAQDSYTLGLATSSTGLFYGTPRAIYHAPLFRGRNDITQYLLSYSISEALPPYTTPTTARFTLGSHDDYLDLPAYLSPGAQLILEEGYHTSTGPEYSPTPPLFIASVSRSPHVITIVAYDTWGALQRRLADFSVRWQTSPALVIRDFIESLGAYYSDDSSPTLYAAGTPPTFTLLASQPYSALITRILNYSGVAIRFYAPEATLDSWPSVAAYVFTPPTSTAGAPAFGSASHPILKWTLDDSDPRANWFTCLYEDQYGEAFNLTDLNELAIPYILSTYEPNAFSTSDLSPQDHAELMRTFYQHRQALGSITTRPHVGLEPGDIIHVTTSPLTGYRRVIAIRREYDATKATYQHTYTLAALPS